MAERIPKTIRLSMNGINIKDLICLEAGTGAGNMTSYLAKRGAKLVYSISDNQQHLDYALRRLSKDEVKRVKFIKADLCKLNFLSDKTIDLITAHMLINVVSPVDLFCIFKELSRVAKKKALIVVNDYNPISSYQTERSHLVEELFRIENAIYCLAEGKPALIWYPSGYITDLLQLLGWKVESVNLLYQKTPWKKELLQEHIEVMKEECTKIIDEDMGKELLHQAIEIMNKIRKDEVIYAGSIYSVKARKNGATSPNSG